MTKNILTYNEKMGLKTKFKLELSISKITIIEHILKQYIKECGKKDNNIKGHYGELLTLLKPFKDARDEFYNQGEEVNNDQVQKENN